MKILIDDANLEQIKKLIDIYPYDGVTTNPTILSKAGGNPLKQLQAIRALIGPKAQLHAQVMSALAEDMVKEAHHMIENLGKDQFFVKVPVSKQGLKAIAILKNENINVTATAIYSPLQGFLAAKAGAKYVAPYVNRLDNLCYDGVQIAKDIHSMIKLHSYDCDVVGASFKNSQQVFELCKFGIGSVTASFDVLSALSENAVTNQAISAFESDFASAFEAGKTMLNY